MKTATSCLQCREAKRKCVRPNTDGPCRHCQCRKLHCSAQLPTRESSGTCQSTEKLLPRITDELTTEFVESYLTHLDGRPHSIFHQDALRDKLRNKEIGKGLLYAICALGCKFSSNSEHGALEAALTREAKKLVQADLENVCVENVQACILLSLLSAGNCQTSSEALFVRVAITMAEVLHLNSSSAPDATILSETSHRIWWSLYILDRWCSSGLGLPRHINNAYCPDVSPLPIDEPSFKALNRSSTVQKTGKLGIFSLMVTLIHNFGPIQDLNRAMAKGDMIPTEKCEAIKAIGHQLETWRQDLPDNMQMSIQNLYSHQQDNLGSHFIALHLVFHHLSALLYFNCLETKYPSYEGQEDHVALCKSHASSFSSLLHLSRQIKGCEQSYPTVGHMTTVASAVLLHTLILGEPEDIPKARQELNTNFEALMELRRYWPATEAMINRLIAFQKICLLTPESHKLDGWMVRFLLEHSLGLLERTLPIVSQNLDLELDSLASKTRELSHEGRYTDFNLLYQPPEGLYH